jgi:aldose 1-epimerase
MNLSKTLWGNYEGQDIYLYHLQNEHITISISNFGAIINRMEVPDRMGRPGNIVLGYNTLQEYIEDEFYTGCVVGRFAGRIADAGFTINGHVYSLAQNEGNNVHLHGGKKGFGKRVFELKKQEVAATNVSIELYYRSQHMEEGYPGNLDVWITYTLDADNRFSINYRAVTDSETHVNLTNHSYFNLSGGIQDILNHQLFIDADNFLVNDEHYVPTGDIAPVANTPYSFKRSKPIISGLANLGGSGYNECYVLNKDYTESNAILYDENSGRQLLLETDMPALLFYTGDYLNGKFYKNAGVCLETQYFPDAPNHAEFPSTLLKPGQVWTSFTSITFGWK